MATSEEELPEELDKLRITPSMAQVKQLVDSNLPLDLNPFFDSDVKANNTQVAANVQPPQHGTSNSPARPANCHRCRVRRASESVLLDEQKFTSNSESVDCIRTPGGSGGVLKQSLKKHTSSLVGTGSRKLLLREPVLKALKTCLHPQSNVRRKLLSSAVSAGAQNFDLNNQSNEGAPLVASKGMSDFRDLIDECHSLLTENVDFSGRLNQMCLSNRNSKNFTTIQTQQIQNNKLRNHRTYQKQEVLSRTRAEAENGGCASELKYDNHHSLNALAQPPLNSLRSGSINSSPEHASSSVRCNTSCSQQAGNTTAATAPSDDVTIDELASYFDTFVHIPKKMSSMAEMMYI